MVFRSLVAVNGLEITRVHAITPFHLTKMYTTSDTTFWNSFQSPFTCDPFCSKGFAIQTTSIEASDYENLKRRQKISTRQKVVSDANSELEGQNVRKFSYPPSRIRWSTIWYLFISITGYLNVRNDGFTVVGLLFGTKLIIPP